MALAEALVAGLMVGAIQEDDKMSLELAILILAILIIIVFAKWLTRGKELRCPFCKKSGAPVGEERPELVSFYKDSLKGRKVIIDQCPQCKSIWLDHSELAQLVGTKQDIPAFAKDSKASVLCPKCHVDNLRNVIYSRDIVIMACPHCFGIWLDRGELIKIKERLEAKPELIKSFEATKDAVTPPIQETGVKEKMISVINSTIESIKDSF